MTARPITDLDHAEAPPTPLAPTAGRQTFSLPALCPEIGEEGRVVTRPRHSTLLVTAGTWRGETDWVRMVAVDGDDVALLIYPSWSDGTETVVRLAEGEVMTIHARAVRGLAWTITDGRGGSRLGDTDGWVRVER